MSDDADLLAEFANFTDSDSESDAECLDKPLSRSAKLAFSEPLFREQVKQWGAPPCELDLYTKRHAHALPARWEVRPELEEDAPADLKEAWQVKEQGELAQAKEWIEKLGGPVRAKAYAEEKYYLRRYEEARVVAEMVLRVYEREGFARGLGFGDAENRDLRILWERVERKLSG
ncbi:hypothetical protein BJ508DRAFT_415720 [Ascobolus immersus RN42]|uniref:Uncharacterized protein n=1 Tax=Ascobolus immersus RN42 TaxID=1160509 RepID=A0A3N4IDA1_ASCIM|nr:hypothetical protein BJ508DRAFT_415720 [Ascobolus immersus RN42]